MSFYIETAGALDSGTIELAPVIQADDTNTRSGAAARVHQLTRSVTLLRAERERREHELRAVRQKAGGKQGGVITDVLCALPVHASFGREPSNATFDLRGVDDDDDDDDDAPGSPMPPASPTSLNLNLSFNVDKFDINNDEYECMSPKERHRRAATKAVGSGVTIGKSALPSRALQRPILQDDDL